MRKTFRVAAATGILASLGGVASLQAASAATTSPHRQQAAASGAMKITYAGFSSMNGLPQIIKGLNKKYAGKYVFQATAYPYANYAALLSSAISGGNPPDIFGASWTPSVYYAREGLELPIGPFVKAAGINTADFPSSLWSSHNLVKGVHYSIPLDAFGTALFYNKALFKKAGLNPNKPPATGAQMIADAKAMKKAGVKYPVIMGVDKTTQDFLYPSLVYQFGGKMGQSTNCASLFDSPAGTKAANWEKSLIYTYHVAPAGPSPSEDLNDFGKGVVGMVMLPAINQGSLLKSLGAKLGVAPLPKIGINTADFVGQQYLWVFKTTTSTTPAGAKGIAILLSAIYKQELPTIAKDNGIIPAYSPALSAVKSMPFFAQQDQMVKTGRVNPAIPNWGTVTGVPLYNNLEDVLLNKGTTAAGLAQAKSQTNQLTQTLPGCTQ
jgi:multiple sugar transport system substrate-binding protein